MRSFVNALAVCVFAALLGIVAPAWADDDVVGVQATKVIQLGTLTLQPGSYLLFADSSLGNHNLVLVMDRDGNTIYGMVLACRNPALKMRSSTDKLVFDEADSRVLRGWAVAQKGFGYEFSSAPVPPVLAARAQAMRATKTAAR